MLRKRVGSVISNQRKTDDSRGVVTREEQFEKKTSSVRREVDENE